ncbi:MAG TPA: MFS transporter [Jiangellaceae bacterium]
MTRRPPLVFIFTVTLTGILSNTLVTPAIPNILDEFDAPPSGAGWLVATGSVAGIIVAPVIGILADRLGRRVILTTCLTIFGVFGGLAALAPSFEILLIARVLQGVGAAGLINLAVVLIGDNWSGPERTRLIGRNTAVLTIGLAGLPLISGVVTDVASWRVTFGIFTVALLTAAAAWTILDTRRPTNTPRVSDQVKSAALVLRQPVLIATLSAGFVVFMIIFGLFLTVVPVHLAEEFGLEASARGVVIALPALTSTLAAFNLGRITSVFSTRYLVVVSSIGLGITFATMGWAGTLVLIVVAALIYGASEGVLIPLLQDLAVEYTPADHRAAIIAVWVAFVRLGQTVGPLVAGVLIGVMGTGATLVTGAAAAGIILLLGLVGPFPRARSPELQ